MIEIQSLFNPGKKHIFITALKRNDIKCQLDELREYGIEIYDITRKDKGPNGSETYLSKIKKRATE